MSACPKVQLFWLDLETTGLIPEKGSILEIGIVLTDGDLNEIDTFHCIVTPLPDQCTMDSTVVQMHLANGLLAEVASRGRHIAQVANDAYAWLATYCVDRGIDANYIAGSSVHFDHRWLAHHMPAVLAAPRLSHRLLDCSSLKIARSLLGLTTLTPDGRKAHRALADCRASIEEYRFYRAQMEVTQ